jgi:hypothetical protein
MDRNEDFVSSNLTNIYKSPWLYLSIFVIPVLYLINVTSRFIYNKFLASSNLLKTPQTSVRVSLSTSSNPANVVQPSRYNSLLKWVRALFGYENNPMRNVKRGHSPTLNMTAPNGDTAEIINTEYGLRVNVANTNTGSSAVVELNNDGEVCATITKRGKDFKRVAKLTATPQGAMHTLFVDEDKVGQMQIDAASAISSTIEHADSTGTVTTTQYGVAAGGRYSDALSAVELTIDGMQASIADPAYGAAKTFIIGNALETTSSIPGQGRIETRVAGGIITVTASSDVSAKKGIMHLTPDGAVDTYVSSPGSGAVKVEFTRAVSLAQNQDPEPPISEDEVIARAEAIMRQVQDEEERATAAAEAETAAREAARQAEIAAEVAARAAAHAATQAAAAAEAARLDSPGLAVSADHASGITFTALAQGSDLSHHPTEFSLPPASSTPALPTALPPENRSGSAGTTTSNNKPHRRLHVGSLLSRFGSSAPSQHSALAPSPPMGPLKSKSAVSQPPLHTASPASLAGATSGSAQSSEHTFTPQPVRLATPPSTNAPPQSSSAPLPSSSAPLRTSSPPGP